MKNKENTNNVNSAKINEMNFLKMQEAFLAANKEGRLMHGELIDGPCKSDVTARQSIRNYCEKASFKGRHYEEDSLKENSLQEDIKREYDKRKQRYERKLYLAPIKNLVAFLYECVAEGYWQATTKKRIFCSLLIIIAFIFSYFIYAPIQYNQNHLFFIQNEFDSILIPVVTGLFYIVATKSVILGMTFFGLNQREKVYYSNTIKKLMHAKNDMDYRAIRNSCEKNNANKNALLNRNEYFEQEWYARGILYFGDNGVYDAGYATLIVPDSNTDVH